MRKLAETTTFSPAEMPSRTSTSPSPLDAELHGARLEATFVTRHQNDLTAAAVDDGGRRHGQPLAFARAGIDLRVGVHLVLDAVARRS